jgi:hypothetical protein
MASEGTWRRGGPSAAAPSARTPPRSESPAPPGGLAWRLREQAKSANCGGGSGPAASSGHEEQPKKTENKDDEFQPPKSVWKTFEVAGAAVSRLADFLFFHLRFLVSQIELMYQLLLHVHLISERGWCAVATVSPFPLSVHVIVIAIVSR